MFSYSFNYIWFMAGQNSALLGLLLLHLGYCSISLPHISLFFSSQAVHLITGVGQGETASFSYNASVILERIQRKKYFERHSRGAFVFSLHTAPYGASSQFFLSSWLPPPLLPVNHNSGEVTLITCLC